MVINGIQYLAADIAVTHCFLVLDEDETVAPSKINTQWLST